jgi:hypothetical protein
MPLDKGRQDANRNRTNSTDNQGPATLEKGRVDSDANLFEDSDNLLKVLFPGVRVIWQKRVHLQIAELKDFASLPFEALY